MAKYLVLIYGDERRWDERTDADRRELDAAHRAFVEAAGGAVVAGFELGASSTATSIRGVSGGPVLVDGPFVETREVVGGLYVLEAPDLDGALALAQEVPEVRESHSGVEVRPIISG